MRASRGCSQIPTTTPGCLVDRVPLDPEDEDEVIVVVTDEDDESIRSLIDKE